MGHQTIHRHGDKVVRAVSRKSKDQHFLDNDQFKDWIREYQQKCNIAEQEGKELPHIPDNIGKGFLQIATALSRKPYFIGYSFLDDMISDGMIKCCDAVRKFNTELGTSAFAYFQQTIYFEFLERIKAEKKQTIAKASIVQNMVASILDDVSRQEIDADEDFHNGMAEILALNSIEIDYGSKKEKKEKQPEQLGWDIFDVESYGMDKFLKENSCKEVESNEDSITE